MSINAAAPNGVSAKPQHAAQQAQEEKNPLLAAVAKYKVASAAKRAIAAQNGKHPASPAKKIEAAQPAPANPLIDAVVQYKVLKAHPSPDG